MEDLRGLVAPTRAPERPGAAWIDTANWLTVALVALALGGPLVAPVTFHVGDLMDARINIGRVVGALLLLLGVSWLIARGGGESAQAFGRLAAAAIVAVGCGFHFWQIARSQVGESALVRDLMTQESRLDYKGTGLNRDLETLRVERFMNSAAVVEPDARRHARASIARFRDLLHQRHDLLLAECDLEDRLALHLPETPEGLALQARRRAATIGFEDQLFATDAAHERQLATFERMLAWGERQGALLALRDGKIDFRKESLRSEFEALQRAIAADEAKLEALVPTYDDAVGKLQGTMGETHRAVLPTTP